MPTTLALAIPSSTFSTQPLRNKLPRGLKLLVRILPSDVFSAKSPDPDHGRVGTPAVCATMLLAILSPRSHIASELGPKNLIPAMLSNLGNLAFSEACAPPSPDGIYRVALGEVEDELD